LVDNDIDGFNISHFYEEQEGTRSVENDPDIADVTYNIDECFLTFSDIGTYGFTYDNDHDDSKKFFNTTTPYIKYDTLYQVSSNTLIEFKLIKATSDDRGHTVRTGDKVYVLDNNNNYLISNMSDDKTEFIDGKIRWSTQATHDKLLFEVHGYNDIEMDESDHKIASTEPIHTDYGFKLEILPSTIKGLFEGLSNFVDGYEFENDTEFTLIDNDIDGFNVSSFYENEITPPTNKQTIADGTYKVDECFLTYKDNIYEFTYDNDEYDSKKFFNLILA
jgi:hypothetical protein